MKAVLAVKDQFTLADVLPSSLDASLLSNHSGASHHASVRSHHSAGGAPGVSQNDSGHFRRQQPSADKSMMSDGLCHNQEVEQVEHKETVEERPVTDGERQATELLQADDS